MGRRAQQAKVSSAGRVPGPEDFTRKAIYRAVLKDTVQHPLTILPAAASALGGLYMVLFGLGLPALAVAFGGALAGTGAWVYNYFIRGEALAERRVAKLREQREQYRHEQVATLEAEWSKAGLAEGVQQARELREAYLKLSGFLEGRLTAARKSSGSDAGLGVQRLMVLAEDTYREGAGILRGALDTYRALQQIDHEKLRVELDGWRSELETVRGAGAEPARAEALETRITSHERRLELFEERVQSIDRLFAESEALESALESTYLEAVDLEGAGSSLLAGGGSASALERAVEAARRVEDRLRAQEQPNKEDDIYLTAGDRQS